MSTTFKRGNTFDYSGTATVTDNGVLVADMTGWSGACMIRQHNGALVANIEFTWLNAAARIFRLRAINTTAWRIGAAEIDVAFTSPTGDVISTETSAIEIDNGPTHA